MFVLLFATPNRLCVLVYILQVRELITIEYNFKKSIWKLNEDMQPWIPLFLVRVLITMMTVYERKVRAKRGNNMIVLYFFITAAYLSINTRNNGIQQLCLTCDLLSLMLIPQFFSLSTFPASQNCKLSMTQSEFKTTFWDMTEDSEWTSCLGERKQSWVERWCWSTWAFILMWQNRRQPVEICRTDVKWSVRLIMYKYLHMLMKHSSWFYLGFKKKQI